MSTRPMLLSCCKAPNVGLFELSTHSEVSLVTHRSTIIPALKVDK